jgi:hypothetical protein
MKSVIRFERWVLIPLDIAFALLALTYFIGADWIGGILAVAAVLVMGLIGRSLQRGRTAAQRLRGDHQVQEDSGDFHGLTQAESLLVTKGLAYSTPTLTIAVVALAMHYGTFRWWVIALCGTGVAALFLLLSKIVVQLVPMVFAGNARKKSSLLPETITCPHCSAAMSLDEEERWIKCFVCPQCDGQIDLR